MSRRFAFVPAVPALLPEHAGIDDPVAELRSASHDAVRWLVDGADAVSVVAAPPDPATVERGVHVPLGRRVADHLLAAAGFAGRVDQVDAELGSGDAGPTVLVLANGSARRGEKAPGHLDERSFGFDETALRALSDGDAAALAALDEQLAAELLADGVPGLRAVARALDGADVTATTLYAGDPFGVQYWVVTWECAS